MLRLSLGLIFLLVTFALPAMAADSGFGFDDENDDSSGPAVERHQPQPMQAWLEDLKQEVDPEEIVELPLSDENTLVALHLRAFSHQPKGQIILLPGANEHPNWPKGIASLRIGLAEQGWVSLALSLPFYEGWQNPPRQLGTEPLLSPTHLKRKPKKTADAEEASQDLTANLAFGDDDEEEAASDQQASDEDANLKIFNQLAAASQERLAAGLAFLPRAQKQVLILQGESVFWLTTWLAENKLTANQPLVLLFPRQPVGAEAKALEEVLEGLTNHPILDIYVPTNKHQLALAKKRKLAYLRAGNKKAVQLVAESNFNPTNQADQDWLVKRVEGWLRRNY